MKNKNFIILLFLFNSFITLAQTASQKTLFNEYEILYKTNKKEAALIPLRKAAEEGYSKAQFHLGKMYSKGEGVLQDQKEAAKWYLKAAEQGYPAAQNNLGYSYSKGEGVLQNKKEAVNWYRKAAEQGYAAAQFNLGYSYSNGEGVLQDKKRISNLVSKSCGTRSGISSV